MGKIVYTVSTFATSNCLIYLFLLKIYFLYVPECACMQMPAETSRGHQSPWSYGDGGKLPSAGAGNRTLALCKISKCS